MILGTGSRNVIRETVSFKGFYIVSDNRESVINEKFYVNLDEVNIEEFIKVINHNKFANKMPIKEEIINRFSTNIAFKISNINNIVEQYKAAVNKQDLSANNSRNYILAILDFIVDITETVKKYDSNSFVYVNLYDSVVASSFVGIASDKTKVPFIEGSSITEMIKKEDYQISFSCRKTGIISASFATRPITIGNVYYESVPGSNIIMDRGNLTVGYLGTQFDPKLIGDYENLRIVLDLIFTPSNDKLFNNGEEFDKFNKFVNYIKGSETEKPGEFIYNLSKIKMICKGKGVENYGGIKKLISEVIDSINYMCGTQYNSNSYEIIDDTTVEINLNKEDFGNFIFKAIMDV
jgi:hypothetical protein